MVVSVLFPVPFLDWQCAVISRSGKAIMRMSFRNAVIQLVDGKPLAFQGARGVHLECIEGMVWLTLEGQAGDFLLARGERLRIESNGLALVEALRSGAIRLVDEAHWAIRWANRLSRLFCPLAMPSRLARAGYQTTDLSDSPILCRLDIARVSRQA